MKINKHKNESRQVRSIPCEARLSIRANEEGKPTRTIEGRAIVFGVDSVATEADAKTTVVERIAPEAVTEEVLRRSDILMTLYHDDTRILARSAYGKGTLEWERDEEGVKFSFEAPATADGDAALALVARGDLAGCSFAFTWDPSEPDTWTRETKTAEGRKTVTVTLRKVIDIRDFTLTPRPMYPDTSVGMSMRDEAMADIMAEIEAETKAGAETAARAAADLGKLKALSEKY